MHRALCRTRLAAKSTQSFSRRCGSIQRLERTWQPIVKRYRKILKQHIEMTEIFLF